jgi:hypothetical protein
MAFGLATWSSARARGFSVGVCRQPPPKVALVVVDLETVEPWKPRGIKIHGHAEVGERQGRFGTGLYIAVLPQVAWSWGIEAPVFQDGKPDEANGAASPKRTVRLSDCPRFRGLGGTAADTRWGTVGG